MLARYAAPVLAVLGLASAQSTTTNSLCSQATATVSNQADATALTTACTALTCSLEVASAAAGAIDLTGIQTIAGGLSCTGATNLTSLSAPNLSQIKGAFLLRSLTILSTLSMPSLTSVGSINWQTLNQLQMLTFTQQVTQASSVTISDTQLTTLDGLNFMTVTNMNINNNQFLRSFNTQITNVTGLFSMSSNGPNLTLSLPNLRGVNNMTLANVSTVTIPSLASVTGNLGFYGNLFTSLSAPNLTTVGDLTFQANTALTNISMPRLTSITAGSLYITNNTNLQSVTGFPALRTVGAISISGNYTNVSLPALADDKGALYLVSSGNFDCSPFTSLSTQIVKGKITCQSGSTNVQSGGSSGTGGTSGSSSTTSKAAAANLKAVDMSSTFGVVSLAAIFTLVGGAAGVAQLLL